jgi:hypothetical protein
MDMKELIDAVRDHSGMDDEQIIEAGEHGADAGWPKFSYYRDTNEFYDKYADLIWELLGEQADDLGEKHPLAMIASFRIARDVASDEQFKNALAFYALEEAGHHLASAEER